MPIPPAKGASIVLLGLLSAWLLCAQQYAFIPVPGGPTSAKVLFQDSKGRLWIGGDQPACFDGSRFFFLNDYGFPKTEAYEFSEDPSGAMWIAAETGVYRFDGGQVEAVAKGTAISVVAATPAVAVAVVGPPSGSAPEKNVLIRMERTSSGWRTDTMVGLNPGGPLTLDPSGRLLCPVLARGWNEIPLKEIVAWRRGQKLAPATMPLKPYTGLPFPQNGTVKVIRDHSGCIWERNEVSAAFDCGDGILHMVSLEGINFGQSLHEATGGAMILSGTFGMAIGRPGSFRVATRANGFPGAIDVIQGKDGTIWVGTTRGLYRFASPFQTESWGFREGVVNTPWSLTRSGKGMYAGLVGSVVGLNGEHSHWDTVFKIGDIISGLVRAEKDSLLVSLEGRGGALLLSNKGKLLAKTPPADLLNGGNMRVARTATGELWLGGGLVGPIRREGSLLKWRAHQLNLRTGRNVLAIKYEAQSRKVWSCYSGGLVLRDEHGAWTEFNAKDGLLDGGCWDLAPLPNGDIWYSYFAQKAIARIRFTPDGKMSVRQYGEKDGLSEPGDNSNIASDQRGWLWRASDAGIYVANAAQAEAGQWLKLDQSDGFPANDMNSGSLFVDDDQSLWWGADNDIAHYNPPADLVSPKFSPQIFISAFSWAGVAPRMAETIKDLPRGVQVTAHVGSLQFDRRNALQLRYRVLPEQPAWRESGSLDLALGRLSSGTHTLEVQGRVFTGPWSTAAVRSFNVPMPMWSSWPLLTSYIAAITLLVCGYYWLRRRRKAEESEMLPNLETLRLAVLLPEAHELTGTVLDSRFEVGDLLARGGFANVLAGYDRQQKQRCAIKVFRSEVKNQAWIQRRFDQEVEALQRVRHPNVVSIYAHGIAPSGALYLVMEFVQGKVLREILDSGALAFPRAGQILAEIASALDAVHAQQICHRDVKPDNIILRNEGLTDEASILIDFSIAIVQDVDETMHGVSRAAGSFDYMPPEQVIGYADPSSDIYSLARLVIEMLTGKRLSQLLPAASLDLSARVPELLRSLGIALSEESMGTLASALKFDPANRPHSATEFAEPLVRDLRGGRTNQAFAG